MEKENLNFLNDSELFSVKPDSIDSSLSIGGLLKRTKLIPKKAIDIVREFDWKNRGEDISEIPVVLMEERTLSMTGIAQTIFNIYDTANRAFNTATDPKEVDAIQKALSDPYGVMYQTEKEDGFFYYLPWLLNSGSTLRNVQNTWSGINGSSGGGQSKSDSSGPNTWGDVIGAAAGAALAAMTPGIGMEQIQTFQQTQAYSVTITFPLYNTVDVDSTKRNFDFVNLITFQNLKNRTSLVTYIPPSVYTVSCSDTLGGFYMPIAVISNLKIDSIGTVRRTDEIVTGKYLLIPEAYSVSITLTELIPQSTNIFEGALGGNKVKVISDPSSKLPSIQNPNIANIRQS